MIDSCGIIIDAVPDSIHRHSGSTGNGGCCSSENLPFRPGLNLLRTHNNPLNHHIHSVRTAHSWWQIVF